MLVELVNNSVSSRLIPLSRHGVSAFSLFCHNSRIAEIFGYLTWIGSDLTWIAHSLYSIYLRAHYTVFCTGRKPVLQGMEYWINWVPIWITVKSASNRLASRIDPTRLWRRMRRGAILSIFGFGCWQCQLSILGWYGSLCLWMISQTAPPFQLEVGLRSTKRSLDLELNWMNYVTSRWRGPEVSGDQTKAIFIDWRLEMQQFWKPRGLTAVKNCHFESFYHDASITAHLRDKWSFWWIHKGRIGHLRPWATWFSFIRNSISQPLL